MTSAKEVIPIAWNRSRTLSVTISRRWSSSCWQSQQTLGRSDIWDYKYPNRSNSPSSILERDWISLTGLSQKQEKIYLSSPPQNYGTYSHNFVAIKRLALPSWFMIPLVSGSYSRQLPKNSRLVSNTRSMLHTSVFHIRSIRVQYIVIPF